MQKLFQRQDLGPLQLRNQPDGPAEKEGDNQPVPNEKDSRDRSRRQSEKADEEKTDKQGDRGDTA